MRWKAVLRQDLTFATESWCPNGLPTLLKSAKSSDRTWSAKRSPKLQEEVNRLICFMKAQEKYVLCHELEASEITVFFKMICKNIITLLKCMNRDIQDFFQRSQNTELTAYSHERQVNAEREEEEEEEEEEQEVLRLQEEIASSRTSQNRQGNHWQCRTRTRSRSPSEVGTRSSVVSRSATGNLAGYVSSHCEG